VRLPKDVLSVLGDLKLSREAAERAAELRGLSHQRVAQILEEKRERDAEEARRAHAAVRPLLLGVPDTARPPR